MRKARIGHIEGYAVQNVEDFYDQRLCILLIKMLISIWTAIIYDSIL